MTSLPCKVEEDGQRCSLLPRPPSLWHSTWFLLSGGRALQLGLGQRWPPEPEAPSPASRSLVCPALCLVHCPATHLEEGTPTCPATGAPLAELLQLWRLWLLPTLPLPAPLRALDPPPGLLPPSVHPTSSRGGSSTATTATCSPVVSWDVLPAPFAAAGKGGWGSNHLGGLLDLPPMLLPAFLSPGT